MDRNIIIGIIAAIIVVGGGIYLWQNSPSAPGNTVPKMTSGTNESTPAGSETQNGTGSGAGVGVGVGVGADAGLEVVPSAMTITYGANGFSPSSVTIKKGGTVTWVNETGGTMWVASAMHPTHMVYDGTTREAHCPGTTTFDQCASGNRYSFTFDKVGTWNYHDHVNAGKFGSVTVVE